MIPYNCDEVNNQSSEVMFKKIFNLDVREDKINKWGKTEKGIIKEVVTTFGNFNEDVEIPNEAFLVWAEAAAELLKENPAKVLPGIRELLEALSQDKEVIVALLTGNSRLRADAKLKSSGIEKFFINEQGVLNGIFGDISISRSDLIPMAFKKFGGEKYILVDDSIIAGKASLENNIICILVATGPASIDELKEYTPFVFTDFGEDRWKETLRIIKDI